MKKGEVTTKEDSIDNPLFTCLPSWDGIKMLPGQLHPVQAYLLLSLLATPLHSGVLVFLLVGRKNKKAAASFI